VTLKKTSTLYRWLHFWKFIRGRLFHKKFLHKFFYTIDTPVDIPRDITGIRNWVATYTRYTSDKDNYGIKESWLMSKKEVYKMIESKKDDCDGVAVLSVSILHSLGYKNVYLAVGYFGTDKNPKKTNHAYCLVGEDINDLQIIETTGDDVVAKLPELNESPMYHTFIIASANGSYWRK
jgi:hypothetical protein